ncbi:YbaB/EbfC family nucleoid-associated protein [Allosaccharopolyspora coralli]|nr:YbaB/EbfC family nucleoid-associated protein [Allosaccharopolyspora coralli]
MDRVYAESAHEWAVSAEGRTMDGGSFLEEQAGFQSDGATPHAADAVAGEGVAGDGGIRVAVGVEGRVTEVSLDPVVTGRADSQWLGRAVADAVNDAFDDLDRRVRESDGVLGVLADDLQQVTTEFERAMGSVREDISRVQQRLNRY